MNKILSTGLALILLLGAFAVPLNISAQTSPTYNVSFAGDWTCSTDAKNNANVMKSKNVELLQGLGDYAYTDNQQCWIDLVNGLNVKILRGNHEADEQNSADSWDQLVDHFSKTSNPELLNGNFYPYTFKNMYVIVLDTQVPLGSGSQMAFLDAELKKAEAKKASGEIDYVVIASHKMYMSCAVAADLSIEDSCGDHLPTEIKNYQGVIQLIYKYAKVVDLVAQGHDHNWQLSQPLKFVDNKLVPTTAKDPDAVVWGVFGNLGRSLDALPKAETKPLWQGLNGAQKGSTILTLDPQGKKMDLKMFSTAGAELFSTTLAEREGNTPPPTENCTDGIDNDGDGKIDAADPDCAEPPPAEICGDGIDNNGNGQIDEDCDPEPPLEEICGNGIDDNNNGQIDENCPDQPKEICGDGIDNNNNGQIDENCPPPVTPKTGILKPTSIVATEQDKGKEAKYVDDWKLETRWSGEGVGESITFKFNASYPITSVKLSGYGYSQTYKFELGGKQFTNKPTEGKLTSYDLKDLNLKGDTITLKGLGNDRSDYNSYREIHFYTEEAATEICGNGIDDDKDGQIDEDCPAEICGDGVDNNGNGQIDENCDDPDPEEICGNNIDDDGDGSVDEDCPAELCDDGIDNDQDGQIDEECTPTDPEELANNITVAKMNTFTPLYDYKSNKSEIVVYPTTDNATVYVLEDDTPDVVEPPAELCGDGVDNNGNGVIDEECPTLPTEEICDNGIDDNANGQVDEGCDNPPEAEICDDGIDNDQDGLIDEECETTTVNGTSNFNITGPVTLNTEKVNVETNQTTVLNDSTKN